MQNAKRKMSDVTIRLLSLWERSGEGGVSKQLTSATRETSKPNFCIFTFAFCILHFDFCDS